MTNEMKTGLAESHEERHIAESSTVLVKSSKMVLDHVPF
jgi:hypothetical protein